MKENRKAVISWCLYDWANSAFILTVSAGFFPVFFKDFWCSGVEPTVSTARLGFGNAIAGLIVAVLSPFMGALADSGGARKKMLGFFMFLGVISTAALYFIESGNWLWALIVFVVANVGFNSANLFYDSLLVDVASRERMDWVSSLGYSLGYLGCGILFVVNVLMVTGPQRFGIASTSGAVKISFMSASVWWFVFSIPLFLFVKETVYRKVNGISDLLKKSVVHLGETTLKILNDRSLVLFLLAYWLYIDGVHTFVLMAVDFGMAIGLSSSSLMLALIVVQFVAFPSAILFGMAAKKLGSFTMILAGILIYILVCSVGALVLKTQVDYIILAGITGIAQGGIQALSRSYFGKLIPTSESAEYFGFYNVVSRFAVIVGPAVVGSVAFLTRKSGVKSELASRIGMSSITILFVVGALLLILSNRSRKRNAVSV